MMANSREKRTLIVDGSLVTDLGRIFSACWCCEKRTAARQEPEIQIMSVNREKERLALMQMQERGIAE